MKYWNFISIERYEDELSFSSTQLKVLEDIGNKMGEKKC